LRGALGRRLGVLTDGLLAVLARIEAYIDFPEEDLPPEDRGLVARELERITLETDRLLATNHYGELLRDGIKTVIIGAPNAGKSSLLNRLVGRERALVSAEPGTTRDFIEERIIVGPHALRLIDTAGLNPAPGALEKLGMEKTLERAAEADLFLIVIDATRPAPALPSELISRLRKENALVVLNKIDLEPSLSASHGQADLPGMLERLPVSALTGSGMETLIAAITRRADSFQQDVGEDFVAINARHSHALGKARHDLRAGRDKLLQNIPIELVSSDLRSALDALGEILGKIDNERMLDQLFATFCIGK
jgi:tRNA modification GTPase